MPIERTIGRLERKGRNLRERVRLVVATEDRYATRHYLEQIRREAGPLLRVIIAEGNPDHCDPASLVTRLRRHLPDARKTDSADQLWIVFDRDHHFDVNHLAGTRRALTEARTLGATPAVSRPCFEFWLLLHLGELPDPVPTDAESACAALRSALGSYDKTKPLPDERITLESAQAAARGERSRRIAAGLPVGEPQPFDTTPGSDCYLLVEALIEALRWSPRTG